MPSVKMQHPLKSSVEKCNFWAQKRNKQIDGRRDKVLELASRAIARSTYDTLHVNKSTLVGTWQYLKQQAQENLKTHIQDKMQKNINCMVGINQVLRYVGRL